MYMQAYLNDCLLISVEEGTTNIRNKINKTLENLMKWSKQYKLKFCLDRSKMIFILKNYCITSGINVKINNKIVKEAMSLPN